MKLIRLCLAITATLAAACSAGEDGAAGKPGEAPPTGAAAGDLPEAPVLNINQITPRVGLVDRAIEVAVSFDGAARFDLDKAKLDFGPGIEIVETHVAAGAIVAQLVIAPDAKLGAHDVTATVPGVGPAVASKGFHVAVALEAKVAAGKAEQGGLVRVDVANRDRVWFDTENFLLLPLVDQKTPSLVALANQGFTATDGSVVLLGDPLAKPGALGFLGINNPQDPDSASYLTAPDAVTVAARQPAVLTSGTPVDVTLAKELETAFFAADLVPAAATEGLVVEAHALTPEGSSMTPMILGYPASGTVADLIDNKTEDPGFALFGIPATQARIAYPVTAQTKGYFVVLDSELANGPTTKVSLAFSAVRAQILAEKDLAHDTPETAQNLGSLPNVTTTVAGRIVKGELKADGEADYYRFSGLSPSLTTDMLVSVTADADVVVRIDTVPTFDSDNLVEVTLGGSGGSGATSAMVGRDRFIQVTSMPESTKQTGKYTLGMKRLPAQN